MNLFKLSTIIGFILLLAACTSNLSSDYYDVENAGVAREVVYGHIMGARVVTVSGETGVGALAGAAAGGTAGSVIGGGSHSNILGAIGGAVVGGIIGKKAEERLSKQQAIEYTIRLMDKRTLSVVQSSDDQSLQVADCVRVVGPNSSRARVVRANEAECQAYEM